ncbi:MAG: gliding motility protein GldM [Saprospiraceae bacterium]|nr:gliding motility protein GldM [Saprospiraceae bacterium]
MMYLVLTAMLALNVSAEIINAFFALNKGIRESSDIVGKGNNNIMEGIKTSVNANPTKYGEWLTLANQAKKISDDFETYMNGVVNELTEAAGGKDEHYSDGRPKKYKDKDITTNLFLSEAGGKGRGADVEKKIKETREALLALIKDPKEKEMLAAQIPLMVDAVPADAQGKTWVDLKFKQMPVAAVMPILSKITADANTSEASILNYCLDKASGKVEIKFDGFRVAIAPKKAYLIRGDKFEAEVYMAAFSKSNNNVSISVNGQGLPVKEGVAMYSSGPQNELGEKTVSASATIKNPFTGEVQTVKGEMKYEVGEKSATVSADKMNVFYIGVDNPISVAAAGVSSNSIRVSISNGQIKKTDNNNYVVNVTTPGEAIVTVSAEGGLNVQKKFRVKKIPNPAVMLPANIPSRKGGRVNASIMSAQNGLIAELEGFDFDARCSVQSFAMVYIPRREDPRQANNNGGAFSSEAQRFVSQAKPGDTYNFMSIKARCPGDAVARELGGLSFMIQ